MLGQGIPKTEYLTDRVCISFHLQHCAGVPDEEKIFEVKYEKIDSLPPAPPLSKGEWTLEKKYVQVDIHGRPIIFVYENYLETYSGPWSDEWIDGPYQERSELKMAKDKGERVIVWLVLEDREEYGACYEDGTPIAWTREVWKRVTLETQPYGPESLSRSVPLTEKEAEKLLEETDIALAGALHAKLGVTSRREHPGLPKGPYYEPVNLGDIRSRLRAALEIDRGNEQKGEKT